MPAVSTPGAAAASGSASSDQLTTAVTIEKEPQPHGSEAAFHLNPTEPHSYQVHSSVYCQ